MATFNPQTAVLISADSHLNEPDNLWADRLPSKLRDRAPRKVVKQDGYKRLVIEGIRLDWSKSLEASAEEIQRMKDEARRKGDKAALRHAYNVESRTAQSYAADPERRGRDLDLDGITAEIIYPGTGLFLWAIPDPELEAACCRVYNDWVVETLSRSQRFLCPAMIPMRDLKNSLSELEYARKKGLRAAMLPMAGTPSYNHPEYEPLWAACAALNMPIAMHQGTGHDMIHYRGPNSGAVNYATTQTFAARTLGLLAMSGVMERYPGLHFVAVECGAGWMAWLMHSLDEAHEDLKYPNVPLKERPSAYLRRNAHATFQDDPVALHNIKFTGSDCLLWGSDYPHDEGTFPESRQYVSRLFADVQAKDAVKIVGATAARIFGLEEVAKKGLKASVPAA